MSWMIPQLPKPTSRPAASPLSAKPKPARAPSEVAIIDFDVHHGNGTEAIAPQHRSGAWYGGGGRATRAVVGGFRLGSGGF